MEGLWQMFSWGGGGRQCLVLRGTRVPPSCKWEGTETGILLAQTGMRIPVWARRILPSWGRSCLVHIQCVLSSETLKTSSCKRSLLELGGSSPAGIKSSILWRDSHKQQAITISNNNKQIGLTMKSKEHQSIKQWLEQWTLSHGLC